MNIQLVIKHRLDTSECPLAYLDMVAMVTSGAAVDIVGVSRAGLQTSTGAAGDSAAIICSDNNANIV